MTTPLPTATTSPHRPRRARPGTWHRGARPGVAAALVVAAALGTLGCSDDPAAAPPASTGTTAPAPTTTTTEAPVDAGERIYVYDPQVGDCFDRRTLEQEDGGERIILRLDCALPHQFEVFAVVEADPAALPPPTVVTTTTAPPADPSGPLPSVDGEGNPVGGPATTAVDEEGTTEATATTTTTVPPGTGYPGQDVLERYARQVCPQPFEAWVGTPYVLSELEIAWVLPEEEAWANGERSIGCTVYDPAAERMVGTQAGSGR